MSRLTELRARWAAMPRKSKEWFVVVMTLLVIASVLGGLTTHDEIGWRQMVGFGLVMAFYAIFALGLSLEFGYTGLLNLGHVGFMAIGAYVYGILMMEGGRPDNAAPVVGWLFDQTPVFEGGSVWGVVACLVTALVAAALLLIPLLLVMETTARREAPGARAPRRLMWGAILAVVGSALTWAAFAIGPVGKHAFFAGLIMFGIFAGVCAAVAGVLLILRALVGFGVGHTPLARSRRGRALVAGALALAVGVWVFVSIHPLDQDGARAVGVLFSVMLGMVLAAGIAALLGMPAIRLREDYLAIVTLGFAEILRSVILNEEAWTRGAQPIQSFPRPVATWASGNDWWRELAQGIGVRPGELALLIVSVLILGYIFALLHALSESPWGRVLKAIREDEDAASALGKPVAWFKLQALMLGSAIAALAGVLYVSQTALVTHLQFLPIVTFYAFIVVVIGGIGDHKGALVGALVLWGIFFGAQNAGLENFGIEAGPAQYIVVGVILIVVMMFRPQGVVGRKEELLFAK